MNPETETTNHSKGNIINTGIYLIVGIIALNYIYPWITYYIKNSRLKKITIKKREQLKDDLDRVTSLLAGFSLPSSLEARLIKANISELHILLFSNNLVTCVSLFNFFSKRTITLGRDLNLIVQMTYDYGLELAQQRDIELKKYSQASDLPPLFGIPVSIQDHIEVKGYDSTLGSANFCFKPHPQDGFMINLITAAGGVPFVKTNLPQLLLINETNNWIVGYAKNPWDISRNTGGSSGGEAGLVALGCSPIGLGTDGGGSVRIPALATGVPGFQPTGRRVNHSKSGVVQTSSYVPMNITWAPGPLAKTVEDCERMMKTFMNPEMVLQNDTQLAYVPWDEAEITETENQKKLRIGVLRQIELYLPSEANSRAI